MTHTEGEDPLARDLTALGPVIYRRILRRLSETAGPSGPQDLTIPQRLALMAIADGDDLTVTQVAQRTAVVHSTATRMVHGLVRRGLARETQATEGDRRRRLVSITAAGRAAVRRADDEAYARATRLVASLDAATRTELQRGMQILLGILRDDELGPGHSGPNVVPTMSVDRRPIPR